MNKDLPLLASGAVNAYDCGMNTQITFHPADLDEIVPGLAVRPLDKARLEAAQVRLDSLTKPQGSLGRLEELAQRLFAIGGGHRPINITPAMMFTVAGDHGVVAQKICPFPQVVTRQMVQNFLAGGAAVNALCLSSGMDLRVVDAGCAGGPYPPHPQLIDRRLGDGTADLSTGPAMNRATCLAALRAGVELAQDAAQKGYRCLGTGEMGIGNSTPATALYCAYLGMDPQDVAGPGTGAEPPMVRHKAEIVGRALGVNAAALEGGDPVAVLAALGGFEIAMLAGIMLGAASTSLPVLVDGFICSAAYVAAVKMCPQVAGYAFLAHTSAEPGHRLAMTRMAGEPLLHLGMRLGEGTGAAVAYGLLKAAASMFDNMASMAEAGVSSTEADKVR